MNGLLLVIGVCFFGAAVALVLRGSMLSRIRATDRLAEIDAYGFPRQQAEERTEGFGAALDRVAERLAGAVSPRLAGIEEVDLRQMMMAAGIYETTPRTFLGYRVLSALGVTALWAYGSSAAGIQPSLALLGLLLAALSGWVLPLTILRTRAERRLEEIDGELPELIDTLVVTVEAGLGFSGALQMAGREARGALADEIQLMVSEQSMGLSTSGSLENLGRRIDTPAMRSFVRSVLQGERLGVSTGEIMRGLAIEMRARRRAAAEERAQKAPVKILFPLVLFLLPAIFIVLLYPAVRGFSLAFGGG
jgi:tight adherence protein C